MVKGDCTCSRQVVKRWVRVKNFSLVAKKLSRKDSSCLVLKIFGRLKIECVFCSSSSQQKIPSKLRGKFAVWETKATLFLAVAALVNEMFDTVAVRIAYSFI